jgi:hypothetical protein
MRILNMNILKAVATFAGVSACVSLWFASSATAEGILEAQSSNTHIATDGETGFKKGSVVVAPIPFSNATIGAGLAVGAGYMFRTAPATKPSMIGVGTLQSDNGTTATGITLNYIAPDNRWILKTTVMDAKLNYDLYLLDVPVPFEQDGQLLQTSLAYGPRPDVNFGVTFRYLDTGVGLDPAKLGDFGDIFGFKLRFKLAALGLNSEWDRRDDNVYPTKGHILTGHSFYGYSLDDDDFGYLKAYANLGKFWPIFDRGVLAARGSICASSQDTPFFDLCSLGGTDKFRGFPATQFMDQRAASAQVEYRHQFSERFGAVLFGGIGNVAGTFPHSSESNPKAAAGAGIRIRLSKKFKVDYAIDATRNTLEENQLYVYVGQRF